MPALQKASRQLTIRWKMNKFLIDFPEKIETERLLLRPYKAGDGPLLFAAGQKNREHLAEFESDNVLLFLKNETHAEATARELSADWVARQCFFIGIFEKTSSDWAGQIYIGPTNWDLPEFTIGYVADVDFEGKGYISEAVLSVVKMLFEDIGAYRVTADCNENNTRSFRLLERCGFRKEGHLLENRKNPDGTFHGDYLFAMLRREYFEFQVKSEQA
jgi:RimJ/RimL family protein N-acetyltransferase